MNDIRQKFLVEKSIDGQHHTEKLEEYFINNIDNNRNNNFLNVINPHKDKYSKADVRDGNWIILQNWTQCSLLCGGGKSYLHRMCIPPKAGGKPCKGNAVLIRECNKQICPTVRNYSTSGLEKRTSQTSNLSPIDNFQIIF